MLRRLLFDLRYRLGRPPWDSGVPPPELRAVVERADAQPGRAIDLGCGTGTNVVYLARLGWEAIGVDFAPRAIAVARRKAADAGVAARARFTAADVTDLRVLDPGFDLALDMGCFHSLPAPSRDRYVAELRRLLRPGATYLLYAFKPSGPRGGVAEAEVRARFSADLDLVAVEEGVGRASAWYRFRRR